jgi:acyl-CoA thioesterase I
MSSSIWIFTMFLASMVFASGADARKTIVFFGDSLTAGYGLDDPARSFPSLIQQKIDQENLPYRVVNAGVSGDTTAGGLRRIDWALRQPIDIFVLELGGNDGLRGLPTSDSEKNLQSIIEKVRSKNPQAVIVLAGMLMPPNFGEDYTKAFAQMYPKVADKAGATLIPFILEGVGGIREYNQADQIHPNPKGHERVAETVWKTLRPLLAKS